MTEKEIFLATHSRESQTTLNLLKALPGDKLSLQPHPKSRTARDLAFVLANQELLFKQAVEGALDESLFANQPPATIEGIAEVFQKNSAAVDAAIRKTPEADLGKMIHFFGQDMPRMAALWGNLFDLVHHRGQFSVYVRMSGAKLPSIYGPTADTGA